MAFLGFSHTPGHVIKYDPGREADTLLGFHILYERGKVGNRFSIRIDAFKPCTGATVRASQGAHVDDVICVL